MIDNSIKKIKKNKGYRSITNTFFLVLMLFMAFVLLTTVQTHIRGEDPALLGYQFYYVASGSMTPTIPVGSLIVVRDTNYINIENEDIVTFKGLGNTLVTHRVREVSGDGQSFITRGDANNMDDPMPVTVEKLVGKVVFHIPYVGYLLKFLKSQYGLVVLITFLILTLIMGLVSRGKKRNSIKK